MGANETQATSFAFHRSYDETFQALDDAQRLQLFDAMRDYAFRGVAPEFGDRLMQIAWSLMAPNVKSSADRSAKNSTRTSARKTTRDAKTKQGGKRDGKPHGKPCGKPESTGTERSGVDENPSSSEEEGFRSTAPSGPGAAAAKAAPPLPDGWERTGVVCSHVGCDLLQLRDQQGTLWCPGCDFPELSMMGVVSHG